MNRAWRSSVRHELAVALVLLAVIAATLAFATGWGIVYALVATAAFALAIAVVGRSFERSFVRSFERSFVPSFGPSFLPSFEQAASPRAAVFGAANRVTLARVALAMLLAAVLCTDARQRAAWLPWALVAVATAAALLDAVDGPLARRSGLASPFGARFDMEADAWFVLVLAMLAWQFDRAGAWVLASGAMRYAFVGAGALWPWLAAPLPASRWRQAVCAVQVAALIVALAPVWPRWAASALCAAGLVLLSASFGADVHRLWRRGQALPPAPSCQA
ncbi:MAG: CDP-alcohol phosphatidyltransferase family protein [Rubrivivax sp.]|nr:CDP-alcohol phosphatidyltransferase family protein [Rubrivivax sp.]